MVNPNPATPARRDEPVPARTNGTSSSPPTQAVAVPIGDFLHDMKAYREAQLALDKARPDLLIVTREKDKEGNPRTFRPKRYWMLLARLMGLQWELVSQERLRTEAIDRDTGEVFHARAIETVFRCWDPKNPHLGDALGDGACSEEELSLRQRSLHNLRSRAHTRGACRAISNFVAFGDPVDPDDDDDHSHDAGIGEY